MKILITGCNGMLGSDFCNALKKRDYIFYGLDKNITRNDCSLCENFFECDIQDRTNVINLIKRLNPEIIIHTAAMTDVDGCELDSEKAYAINSGGTENVALGSRDVNVHLIYLSTDYVFDGEKKEPYVETDVPSPINVYGRTKLEGEEFVKNLVKKYCIIRTSWLYGKCGKNFVDTLRKKVLYDKNLKVVMDQYGSPTYAVDLADAILNLVEEISNGNDKINGIFHITNSDNCSWYKFAETILEYSLINNVKIIPITTSELERAARRPKRSILENKRFEEIFEKMRPWNMALRDYVASLKY